MSNNNLYKSITLKPYEIIKEKTGEVLNINNTLNLLKKDAIMITDAVEWSLQTDQNFLDDLDRIMLLNPNAKNTRLAWLMKANLPIEMRQRGIGASRLNELYQDRLITEGKSWLERVKVCRNSSNKFVSQGWRRTANPNRPVHLQPKFNLAAVNNQYSDFLHDPLIDGIVELRMVIQQDWYILFFKFDKNRFSGALRITKPVVRVNKKDQVVFDFSFEYEYFYTNFSNRYVIGVDVGITNYVTLVVWDILKEEIVEFSTLSSRVHSLANSIKATNRQVRSLSRKSQSGNYWEVVNHRSKNILKKRELAVVAGQEIADFSVRYGNALVVFEDLAWVVNTMQNGRWNRGELVSKTREFVELNGGRVVKINPVGTSQKCWKCGKQVVFVGYHVARCFDCGLVLDRDVNAACNVAQRGVKVLESFILTRSKSKKRIDGVVRRSVVPKMFLKYPRSKMNATPRQVKKVKKKFLIDKCSCKVIRPMVLQDATESKSVSRTLKKQHNNYDLTKKYVNTT